MDKEQAKQILSYCLEAASYAQNLVDIINRDGPLDWEAIDSPATKMAMDLGSALELATEELDRVEN